VHTDRCASRSRVVVANLKATAPRASSAPDVAMIERL